MLKNIIKSVKIIIILSVIILVFGYCDNDKKRCHDLIGTDWTVMVYSDGDNDLEDFLIQDIEEMKQGFVDCQGVNLIVLFDRIPGYSVNSTILGENYTDTRLYRITHNDYDRLSGKDQFPEIGPGLEYEANMGDPATLKKFIQYCKENYPADNYALIISNHGGGTRKRSLTIPDDKSGFSTKPSRHVCQDITNGNDYLYIAEITDALTSDESVDLLGFDACYMGSIEVAYQFRAGNGSFNTQVMIASSPEEWAYGWDYYNILDRLRRNVFFIESNVNGETAQITGGEEHYCNPEEMTALEFGGIIVEEQYDSTILQSSQSLSCYNLSGTNVDNVKSSVDAFAVQLVSDSDKIYLESIRGNGLSPGMLYYMSSLNSEFWLKYPFFDLYDLCERVNNDSVNFTLSTRTLASNVMADVDEMLVYSFANSGFDSNSYNGDFQNGKNGVHIFFPDGSESCAFCDSGTYWDYQWWYNAIDTFAFNDGYYGNLMWCDENGGAAADTVENWFEMLDSWYETGGNDSSGGKNGYQW